MSILRGHTRMERNTTGMDMPIRLRGTLTAGYAHTFRCGHARTVSPQRKEVVIIKAWEYDAVAYDGEIYCTECCPVDYLSDDVMPIFASDEVQTYPVCAHCGTEHDYMGMITDD